MAERGEDPKGVLVYCQAEGGTLLPVSLELVSLGQELSARLGEPLCLAMLGGRPLAEELSRYDAARIFYCSDPKLEFYTAEVYTGAMEQIVREANPRALIVGATDQGRDLAARLAARLDTGLTADCASLSIEPGTGRLLQTRPAFNGNVMATIAARRTSLQMATVHPGAHAASPRGAGADKPRIIQLALLETPQGARVLEERPAGGQTPLWDADIVVAGGKGVLNARGVELVNALARALGAAVGASRSAVEEGLFPYDQQIGQTGKSIHPRLYVACGISGSSHHMAGVRAQTILAINRDRNAPIFRKATYGVCGDLFEILPKLTALIEQSKNPV
ncbi:MAG: electron transfer flavoprotein subunit alpha/FixB family protein [Bacillota bacterium]